ncbi:MAG: hypothetical protein LBL58_18620 [Tannerellaceae bacterium]|jgi:hypothetical protein|nr:hypothetical protein [Tannerellaceae bacterium]
MENNELIFRVMVTSSELLKREIEDYNNFFKTDFEIINIIEDEVPFCDIKVKRYKISDIFDLGFCLARLEQNLREKGEINW